MTRRIKKPIVRPELRRQWLQRHEESGESPPEIAKADGYDVRTVRKSIEIERQERERREARSIVLRGALEKHYADICTFARKLDSHITAETDSLQILRDDPMWDALQEHLPRSTVWKNLKRWEALREEIRQGDNRLKRSLRESVKKRAPLKYPVSADETGLCPGIIDALTAHCRFTARGEAGLDNRTDFRLTPADQQTTRVEYGTYTVGRIPNDRVDEVKNFTLTLLTEVTTWDQHAEMTRIFNQLARVQHDLHDELLIIILRRIVPGRCRYCPL